MATDSPESLAGGGGGGDGGSGGGAEEEAREWPQQQLEEKVRRLMDLLASGISDRLPDRGEKLRGTLQEMQRALARRKGILGPPPSLHHEDDRGCDRLIQSRCADSSGLVSGSSANHQITKCDFSSAFGSNEKAGDASNSEVRITTPGESRNFKENEPKMCDEKEPSKPSSEPQQISSKEPCMISSANMEKVSSDDGCKDIGSLSVCENLCPPALSPKRKRDAIVGCSMRLRSRKVQEVVLLDGETQHPECAKETSDKWNSMIIYYPSREHPNSVELSREDMKCLEPESYLSSPVMNFYIMYLQGPMPSINRPREEYYIFNTYFYSKLEALMSKADKNAYFLKLRRWWKGINIFQKAYILLPVHAETHWSLVIICIPAEGNQSGPIILHLDSLKLHSSRSIFKVIDKFLNEEWNYLTKTSPVAELPMQERLRKNGPLKIEKKTITVPQQDNEYDCGLFVLYYMQRFIEEAPQRLKKEDLSMFGKKWFQPEEASALRKKMQTLLLELFENAKSESDEIEPPSSEHSEGS